MLLCKLAQNSVTPATNWQIHNEQRNGANLRLLGVHLRSATLVKMKQYFLSFPTILPVFLKKDERGSLPVSLKDATSKLADFIYMQLVFVVC